MSKLVNVVVLSTLMSVSICANATDYNAGDAIPAPAGTQVLVLYPTILHGDSLYSDGNRISANVDAQLLIARYAYFTQLGSIPFNLQLILPFGHQSVEVPDASVSQRKTGLGDLTLGTEIWQYSDPANKFWITSAHFLSLPTGQYDPNQPVASLGGNRVTFNSMFGFHKGWGNLANETFAEIDLATRNGNYYGNSMTQRVGYVFQTLPYYQITSKWRVGVRLIRTIGFPEYVGDTLVSGSERTWSVAPEVGWAVAPTDHLNLTYKQDLSVYNGVKMKEVQLRWVHVL